MWRRGLVDRLSAYNLALRWFESGCHRGKKSDSHKKEIYICNENKSGGPRYQINKSRTNP